MIPSDLPRIALSDLPGGPEPVVLCATARLAAGLRHAHGELQAAGGATTWQALQSATPAQWLDHFVSASLLVGEIPASGMAGSFLSWPQERCLWERAIAADAGAAADLFDREGMARAAMEAATLQRAWRIEVPAALHTAEYLAFRRWREGVAEACASGHWRTADELTAWRIDCIARGAGRLPARLGLAGFVAPDPVVARLLAVLRGRGVELFELDFARAGTRTAQGVELPDAEAECIAAACWAADRIAAETAGRVRIAVADLPARRRMLESALEDALHPSAVGAGWAGEERAWAWSGGTPLAEQPLVAVALRLLQLGVHARRVAQAGFGELLCGGGWSADLDEADARARVEAALRDVLPPEVTLERLQRSIARLAGKFGAPRLVVDLGGLLDAARAAPRRQNPSAWAAEFGRRLEAAGWPGQRPLLAAEAAACDELRAALDALQALDAVLGRIDGGEALRQLQRHCRDRAFKAPRLSPARVEVCDLDDALAGPVAALWVMGLNEGDWPPAPRPNPLLPAELQRRAGIPAARADGIAAGARRLQELWCEGAATAVFSWARREGERPLRPSPLLAELPRGEWPVSAAKPPHAAVPLERLRDSAAPPVGEGERVHGGTALLKAQALCPAWGFYRYRLGAAVLPAPTFGLDPRLRGNLLHTALEAFWRGRSLADLSGMDGEVRAAEVLRVVDHALAEHDRKEAEPLPPRLRELEQGRLCDLVAAWLEFESRRQPFRVLACEESQTLDIEGLPVRVVVDRLDQLADGRLAVLDYKSGRRDSADSWAQPRITEPQLPIYAALAFPDRAVAAVALARVTREDPAFLGVAATDDLLPGVKALEALRKRYGEDEFPDWEALRRIWAERIATVAREVRDGIAAVVFEDDKAIEYCDVLPLLRIAERKSQFEEDGGAGEGRAHRTAAGPSQGGTSQTRSRRSRRTGVAPAPGAGEGGEHQ